MTDRIPKAALIELRALIAKDMRRQFAPIHRRVANSLTKKGLDVSPLTALRGEVMWSHMDLDKETIKRLRKLGPEGITPEVVGMIHTFDLLGRVLEVLEQVDIEGDSI